MGRSVNKVTLIGTLGRDPEVRYMPNGNAVANLTLATDESYNDRQTGQKVEQTEWHRIVVYGKLAEIVQQYLKKGSKAYFEGRLKTREWEKDGIKRYTTEIIANDMMMLSAPRDGQQQGGYQQPGQMMNSPQGGQGYPQSAAAPQNHPASGFQQPMQQPQQQGGMMQQPQQQQPQRQQQRQQPQQRPQQPIPHTNGFDDFDDDIPF